MTPEPDKQTKVIQKEAFECLRRAEEERASASRHPLTPEETATLEAIPPHIRAIVLETAEGLVRSMATPEGQAKIAARHQQAKEAQTRRTNRKRNKAARKARRRK